MMLLFPVISDGGNNDYSSGSYYYTTTGADMLDFEIVETWWTGGTGLFTMIAANNSSILKSSQVSSRLMVLPSSRIN